MPIWVSVCFLQLKYSSATLLGQFKPSRLAECIWTIWSQNISLIMIENQGTHSWNNIENGTHEQWQKKKTAKPHWLVIGIRRLSQSMGSSYEKYWNMLEKPAGTWHERFRWSPTRTPVVQHNPSRWNNALWLFLIPLLMRTPNVPRFLIVFVITLMTIAAEWLLPHCCHGLQLRHIVDALVVRHLASRWHLRMVGWYSSGTSFTSHLPKSSKIWVHWALTGLHHGSSSQWSMDAGHIAPIAPIHGRLPPLRSYPPCSPCSWSIWRGTVEVDSLPHTTNIQQAMPIASASGSKRSLCICQLLWDWETNFIFLCNFHWVGLLVKISGLNPESWIFPMNSGGIPVKFPNPR